MMKNEDKKKYPMGTRQKMEVREPAVEYAASKRIASPQEPVDRNAPLTRGEFRDTMLRVDDRLVQIDERFDRVDARLDKMDGRLDKMDERFDKMDTRFDKMNDRLDEMTDRFGKVETKIEEAQKRMALLMVGTVLTLAGVYPAIIIGMLHYLK